MAVLFTYQKKKLFNQVLNRTVILARTLKRQELQLTDELLDHVKILFCQAGRNVLKKCAAHAKNVQIPYIQTKEGENFPEAASINFTLVLNGDAADGVIVPLMDSSIRQYIVAYALQEWLKDNGVQPIEDVADLLQEIKRNVEFGTKAKQTYRYF